MDSIEGTHWLAAGSGGLLVLLVVVDLGELRVDHVLLLAGVAARRGTARTIRASAFLALLVHGLAELHGSLRKRVALGADRLGIVALERFLEVRHRILDGASLGLADLGAVLGERLLGGMHQRLGMVLGLDRGLALLVVLGVRLGV